MKKQKTGKSVIQLLRKVSLFKGVSQNELKRVADIAKRRKYNRGEIIFTKNTLGKTIFVVISGQIKIFAEFFSGRRKTFVYLDRGEFFGELALLGKPTRSASAQALSSSELLVIQQSDFYHILKNCPQVSQNLIMVLSQRLRDADKEIESLSFYGIVGRIAKVLINLEKKYGRPGPDGIVLDLALDKKDMAELVGTVREVATRALTKLTNLGCVRHVGKKVVITDKAKLKSIAALR